MELSDFQQQWDRLTHMVEERTEINRKVLRMMLVDKASKRILWFKIDSLRKSLLSFAFVVFAMFYVPIKGGAFSYLGVAMLILLLGYFMFGEIRLMRLISRVQYNEPVVRIRRRLLNIRRVKLKTTIISYLLSPISLLALLLMIHNDFSDVNLPKISGRDLLALIPIGLGFILSIYFSFGIGIRRRFRKLNQGLAELELLEE